MNTNMNNGSNGKPEIKAKNLQVINDQLNYESLMNKKCSQYASYCTDQELINLCNDAANTHKQNFMELKNYLESHQ